LIDLLFISWGDLPFSERYIIWLTRSNLRLMMMWWIALCHSMSFYFTTPNKLLVYSNFLSSLWQPPHLLSYPIRFKNYSKFKQSKKMLLSSQRERKSTSKSKFQLTCNNSSHSTWMVATRQDKRVGNNLHQNQFQGARMPCPFWFS
jgi:hypothetical protein